MTWNLAQTMSMIKAAQHKYTHRKMIGRDPKTNRIRYRYYYAEHHGGGISSASIEEGSAFKLTYKGRRGHFHVQRVEGDKVYVKHDGRPNAKEVELTKSELRALLKRQHETIENKKREKAQEARRKGRKKPAKKKKTQTPREQMTETAQQGADNFETMPEVESAEDLRAEFKRKIEANEGDYSLYVKLFNVANYSETLANVPDSELFEHPITQELFSLTVAYPKDPVYIYLALQELPKEYTKRLFTELLRRYKETGEHPISEGASVGIMQAHQHHFEQSTAPTAPPPIEEKDHPLLGLKTLDLDPQQVRSSYRNISHTPGKRAESERREWAETLDQLEAQAESEIQAGAKREEVEKRYQKLARRLLRTKLNVISARAQTASSAITGAGQFNTRQAQKRQQVLESREAQYRQALQEIKDTQPPTPSPAREQLTETTQPTAQRSQTAQAFSGMLDAIKSGSGTQEAQRAFKAELNKVIDKTESGTLTDAERAELLPLAEQLIEATTGGPRELMTAIRDQIKGSSEKGETAQATDTRNPIARAVDQATPAHAIGYSSDAQGRLTIGGFIAERYGYTTKKEAVADAKAKGHSVKDIVPVSNRFWTGYAISRIDPVTKERVFFDKTSAEPEAIKVPLADRATHHRRGHLFDEGGDIRTTQRTQGKGFKV